jgi:hypothetical protein
MLFTGPPASFKKGVIGLFEHSARTRLRAHAETMRGAGESHSPALLKPIVSTIIS